MRWVLAGVLWIVAACDAKARVETAAVDASAPFAQLATDPETIAGLKEAIAAGSVNAEGATRAYLDRIAAVDDAGPMLNAVIALNPDAIPEAAALDKLAPAQREPLHGVPILMKDNIDTLGMPTTAGSLALQDNMTGRDAPVVARLRAAGAVILGKTNLSEWANFRDNNSSSGWSGLGGLTKNPHVLDRNPCGSSSGSGAAIAAGLAAAAVGTETDGSIICPSAQNGIVGIKPTVGLIPRTHIVPISSSQDTAGPMALTVADAALLLTVMAGSDPSDPATAEADARKQDYTKALDPNALNGKRLGVLRFLAGYSKPTDEAFNATLGQLQGAGAKLIEIEAFPNRRAVNEAEWIILIAEFKAGIDAYLASTPAAVKTRTLADLIAFNQQTPAELEFFGQDIFEESAKAPALTDKAYLDARERGKRLAGPEGIDKLLADHQLDALIAPSGGPAWTTDLVNGDHFGGSASGLPAVAGYPHITVPMADIRDLPVGLSFIGPAWSEAKLIGLAYAYEQLSHARKTPAFLPSSP
jgi:amidase